MDRNQFNRQTPPVGNAGSEIERDAIRSLQTYLRQLSFHNSKIPSLPADGIWEDATKRALMEFQRQQNLPPTGIADRATWEILKAEYDKSVAMNSPPVALALFPRYPEGFELSVGDRGILVDAVQLLLGELERLYFFPDFSESDFSGVYDEKTATLIRDFQARNSIPVTGKVDRETWDAMAIQYNLLLSPLE